MRKPAALLLVLAAVAAGVVSRAHADVLLKFNGVTQGPVTKLVFTGQLNATRDGSYGRVFLDAGP